MTVSQLDSVAPCGEGIGAEHLEDIFMPFFSTKESRGTGLGLAVTKKITEEHGGVLQVESTLGEGTAFHLVLPGNDLPDSGEDA